MSAQVKVIQDFIGQDGQWVLSGNTVPLDEQFARKLASDGYVEIVSVDGATEFFKPCCSGEH